MRRHDFGYFFHEGISNMFSHGFMSFAAIGITVACLLIMGTFTLVAVNADAQLKDLERDNEILAYVDENYTQAQAKALQSRLEAVDNVASATFITKEQAMEDFIAKYPDEDYFQDLDPSILRDRYAIKVKDLTRQSQTVTQIKAVAGIAKVNAYEELAGGFITIRNIATVICVALIAVLFVVSVFIISNTIKLTTFDRKDEIAIMLPTVLFAGPLCTRALCWVSPVLCWRFCCNGGFTRPLPRALARVIRCSLFPWCPLHSSGSRWRGSFWQRASSSA